MALRLRIERRRPPLPRFFSSSAPDEDDKEKDRDPQPSSVSSRFSDVMATLKHKPSGDLPLRRPTPHPSFLSRSQQQNSPESMAGLQKRLAEFRSSVPPPPPPSSGPSFMKVYQKNDGTDPSRNDAKLSMAWIKESLKGIRDRGNASGPGGGGLGSSGGERMSLSRFTDSLNVRPADGVGKDEGSSLGIFWKEIKDKKEGKTEKPKENLDKIRFTKSYAYEELGEKLRMLRSPADGGTKGFSLEELNERLVRLKEMEKEIVESKSKKMDFDGLREVLASVNLSEDEKRKNDTRKWAYYQDVLGTVGSIAHSIVIISSTLPHCEVAFDGK